MKAWAPMRVETVRRAAVFMLEVKRVVVELTVVWSVSGEGGRGVSAVRGGGRGRVVRGGAALCRP